MNEGQASNGGGRKRRKKRPNQKVEHADLVSAINHGTRVAILKIYFENSTTLSPKQLSDMLDLQISVVSYHIRVLAEKNVLELVEEEPVRGSVAHFYELPDVIRTTPWLLESLDIN